MLPTAAAHLIEHYIEGPVADLRPATIVLPGRRARRRVIELLLDEAEVRGATLIPPQATTVGGLPELLHTSPKPFADEPTSRRAWSRALRDVDRETVERAFPRLPESDGPTEWDELAGLLAGLHETLTREGHPFRDVVQICRSGVLFDDGARWGVLAQVQKRYLQLLDRSGLADRFETRRLALEFHVPPFTGDIWLVSVVELPDVTRRLLDASGTTVRALIHAPAELNDGTDATTVFDTFGLPLADYWETAAVPVADQILTVVERPVDQAEAVMDGLANLGGAYSAGRDRAGRSPRIGGRAISGATPRGPRRPRPLRGGNTSVAHGPRSPPPGRRRLPERPHLPGSGGPSSGIPMQDH